jgi:hypothetical protein
VRAESEGSSFLFWFAIISLVIAVSGYLVAK